MLSVKPRRITARRYIDSSSMRALYGVLKIIRGLLLQLATCSWLQLRSFIAAYCFGDGCRRTRACGVALNGAGASTVARRRRKVTTVADWTVCYVDDAGIAAARTSRPLHQIVKSAIIFHDLIGWIEILNVECHKGGAIDLNASLGARASTANCSIGRMR